MPRWQSILPAVGPINLPPLGLFIVDGSAQIDLGFYANLGDPSADRDGDGILDVSELNGAFQAEAFGSAMADLPMYFPIKSLPLGGFETDRDGKRFC